MNLGELKNIEKTSFLVLTIIHTGAVVLILRLVQQSENMLSIGSSKACN